MFKSLIETSQSAKHLEHLALGFLSDLNNNNNMNELLVSLKLRHAHSLKSLHIATLKNSKILSLKSSDNNNDQPKSSSSFIALSNLLHDFINLTCLSIDYDQLTHEFLGSSVCLNSLKK
jgi:hypothetical protein